MALRPLVGMWFQVQCPPLVGVLPIFRSRYLFAIGHQRVFSLTGWTPQIRTHFHVLSRTQDTSQPPLVSFTGLSPSMVGDSTPFYYKLGSDLRSYNPGDESPVWANPLSLAATDGIEVSFFSCRY